MNSENKNKNSLRAANFDIIAVTLNIAPIDSRFLCVCMRVCVCICVR